MFNLDYMKKYAALSLVLILVGCFKEKKSETTSSSDYSNISTNSGKVAKKDSLVLDKVSPHDIRMLNGEILTLLKTKNYTELAQFIHPEKGIRFSMYGYVQPKKDKVFIKDDFLKYIGTNIKFTWGEKDGTGDLLQMSLKNYLEKWVFAKDFTIAEMFTDEIKQGGNTINNIKDVYPNSIFTENYLSGSEEYAQMDWNSLRLVFEEFEGKLFLVGIINDRWTV